MSLPLRKSALAASYFPELASHQACNRSTPLDHPMHGIARQAAGDGLPPRATYIHAPTDQINHPLPRRTVN